uniref:N-acylneuraminate cytidylyltransferase n=1 Tax=Daphnia galeata TaxID=27404 RepID=A0A8J2VYX7_9CRUS|nr:unnamed protein product [Daphnia galeata]
MTLHVAGLILARGGSKGIPLKNLALLKGTPLLLWALKTMSRCQGLTSIWVSSDHQDILQLALENGAKVHRRSAETSSDGASSLDAITEFLSTHPGATVAEIRAVNFDPHCRPKRQDWNGDLVENGAFYLSSVQLLRKGLIQGGKISFVEMSAECSIDIDTVYDLWLAEQQASYFGIEPGGEEL